MKYYQTLFLQTGAYLAGPNFTMADICFLPFISFGVCSGLGLDKFPYVKAYYERACARPSIKAVLALHEEAVTSAMTPIGLAERW
jgi:GST-like protein